MEVAHPQSGFSSTWFMVELEFGNAGFFHFASLRALISSPENTYANSLSPLGAQNKDVDTACSRYKPRLNNLCDGGYLELSRDLWIRGRGRLRVRNLTSSFFAYSQNIDSPDSFILPFFIWKVSTVIFSEGGVRERATVHRLKIQYPVAKFKMR